MKEKTLFDYSKLKGRITEIFGTQKDFLKKINLSQSSFSKKINNSIDFKQSEIRIISEVLKIEKEKIDTYFFSTKN